MTDLATNTQAMPPPAELDDLPKRTSFMVLAMQDIGAGLKRLDLAAFLAWRESFLPYKMGFLGPVWITLQTAFWVIVIGMFIGPSLKLSGGDYYFYIASGFIVYSLFMVYFTEGSQLFVRAAPFILNVPNPFSVYALKLIFKAFIQIMMALPVLIVAMIATNLQLSMTSLWAIPGLILASIFGFGAGLALGTFTAIMRDVTFAVQTLMRLMMFITPIFWVLEKDAGGVRNLISQFNPIHQYLEVIRAPLLGQTPTLETWIITSGLAVAAFILGVSLFAFYRNKLAVWL